MDWINAFLEALPAAGTNPLSFVAYALTLVVFAWATARALTLRRLEPLLRDATDDEERSKIIRTALGEPVPPTVTAQEFLDLRRARYKQQQFGAIFITVLVLCGLAGFTVFTSDADAARGESSDIRVDTGPTEAGADADAEGGSALAQGGSQETHLYPPTSEPLPEVVAACDEPNSCVEVADGPVNGETLTSLRSDLHLPVATCRVLMSQVQCEEEAPSPPAQDQTGVAVLLGQCVEQREQFHSEKEEWRQQAQEVASDFATEREIAQGLRSELAALRAEHQECGATDEPECPPAFVPDEPRAASGFAGSYCVANRQTGAIRSCPMQFQSLEACDCGREEPWECMRNPNVLHCYWRMVRTPLDQRIRCYPSGTVCRQRRAADGSHPRTECALLAELGDEPPMIHYDSVQDFERTVEAVRHDEPPAEPTGEVAP
ncbi:MAG: hypothetical protein EVA89_06330 [Sandaracinaceae bacterium]|nr:MAG: hypothetical protein EVA89_06330 [Sandaracinaceae bacterium]